MNRSTQAFTLIELLVVISIIALLIAILLPALSSARAASITMKCATQLRDINLAVDAYALDHNGHVPLNRNISSEPNNRWTVLITPYHGRQTDKSGSQRDDKANAFLHYKCPTQHVDGDKLGAVGIYGYNSFFGGLDGNWNAWRKKDDIIDPTGLPFFADTNGLDGSTGGYSMSFRGPNQIARNYGWTGPTNNFGPAANHNGATVYVFADGHTKTEGEIWPWSDFIGTDFHPKRDVSINP